MNSQTTYNDLPQYLKQIVEDRLDQRITHWTKPDCGLSSAIRYSLQLEDQNKVFIKAATDHETEESLRTEHLVLTSYNEDFMPALVGWIDEPGSYPILITQDFSDAHWAAGNNGVYWRKGDIDLLLDTVKKLSTVKGHPSLSKLRSHNAKVWTKIAVNPDGFLKLNLCSGNWLKQSINYLIEAENNLDNTGEALVHGDIRSDNVCIAKHGVIFVDWSHAASGNSDHDLANLLPTLHLEGGPTPYQFMPNAGDQAAYMCATHIQRLSKEKSIPLWLTKVFKKLVAIELEWAAKCLNLDKPDGTNWKQLK